MNAVLLPTKGRDLTPKREDQFHSLAHSTQGSETQGQPYSDTGKHLLTRAKKLNRKANKSKGKSNYDCASCVTKRKVSSAE